MEPNPKVKIISDSTCDLSQELTAKYDIDILPLHILLGENEFRDGKDITPERIFAWADETRQRRKPLRRLWRMPRRCCSRMSRPAVR